ncbi:hypothetical protein [Aquamicrobium soli]|uniref:Uncharacterized protein n=1 Tax=Aquamicrobium soli TaxID=1811518 RepID=A0ABV7K935_9HYPH
MPEYLDDMPNSEIEKIKIILNTLYLCIGYAIRHIDVHEGQEAASSLKANMLDALKNGDIDMALLEDRSAFELVVSKIEQLTWRDPIAERLS